MGPTVILEHEHPDGDTHFDWLLAPDDAERGPDKRDLVHFKIPKRPDSLAVGAVMQALRGPPHRRRYLTFEGDLEGDRGSVRRVGEGTAEYEDGEDGRMLITATFKERTVVVEAREDDSGDGHWILRRTR